MTLLPEVREALLATAVQRSGSSAAGRPRAGQGLPVVLGVACAIAVAVVAVVALSHHAPAKPQAAGAAGSGLAKLEAKLAVLRRPQMPADEGYTRYATPRGGAFSLVGVVARLSRLATTITVPTAGRVRVYILVRQRLARTAPPALRAGLITAVAIDRHGVVQGVAATAGGVLAANAVDSGPIPRPFAREANGEVSLGIVPDGVTRVKWTFTGAGYGILEPRPVTVYPQVRGNVAVAPVKSGQGPLASAVWYGADGKVIAAKGGGLRAERQLQEIRAVNASRDRPISSELLAHYRLFRSVPPLDLALSPVLPTAGAVAGDLNFWQTRYIGSLTGLDGRGVWVTPGARDLCIAAPGAGDCTAPLSRGDDAGILGGGTFGQGLATITGLVPDGNATVTVELANGARRTFPVIDNVYEATVRGHPVAIIDRDIHGRIARTPIGF